MISKRKLGLAIGISLILFSIAYVAKYKLQEIQQENWAQQQVDLFINKTQENKENPQNKKDSQTKVDNEDSSDIIQITNAEAIMSLPTLNRKFPLITESINNIDSVEKLLKQYAVIYEDYGQIGFEHHNAVISAHSAINDVGCGHCYFDGIEAMQAGEMISILQKDGTELIYEIVFMKNYCDPNEDWFYEEPLTLNESWITLITCTNGDSAYRTIVRAKLMKTIKADY